MQSSNVPLAVKNLVDFDKIIEVEKVDSAILKKKRLFFFSKRLFDICACSVACVLSILPIVVIAIFIKADSKGPVFYKQDRLGLNGKPFKLVKFRSMRVDAEAQGAQWASANDSRVTRVGQFLRKTRLDEIPQFFQVVTGSLSLIGPRPERPVFYEEFEKHIHGFKQRLLVKPGITGLAQVSGGYDLLPAEKIIYDIQYIKHCSWKIEMKIIVKTLLIMFSHNGAR